MTANSNAGVVGLQFYEECTKQYLYFSTHGNPERVREVKRVAESTSVNVDEKVMA